MSKQTRHTVTRTKITKIKRESLLPEGIASLLRSLTYPERIAYCRALRAEGWSYKSMAIPLGISGERVRQMVTWGLGRGPQYREAPVSSLPVPKLPNRVSTQEVKKMKMLPEDTVEVLKALQAKAFLVRSHSPLYRAEAEEFARLLNDLVTKQGYSVYGIAKQIGVTQPAIQFRLVRYGYRQSLGKSECYRKIIYSNRHKPVSGRLITARLEKK